MPAQLGMNNADPIQINLRCKYQCIPVVFNRATVRIDGTSTSTADMVVFSPCKLGEVMVYAFLNMCSHLGLSRVEAVMTLHSVVFGDCEKYPLKEKFQLEDFGEVQDDPYG